MSDIIVGIIVSFSVILFLEIFKSFDKRLIASLTLAGIAFIYVGFVWNDLSSLGIVASAVLIFIFLAYYGYTKDFRLIILGLILHGTWDLIYPRFNPAVPKGYDIFCLTADFILALYFYLRAKTLKQGIKT
ncbi:MAG: DUF6010 family protein [Bacteroidota bacterium]